MAFSERNTALDDIATTIKTAHQQLSRAKQTIEDRYNDLLAIPSTYSDIITEIQALDNSTAINMYQKAALSALQSEFVALRNAADDGVTALSTIEAY